MKKYFYGSILILLVATLGSCTKKSDLIIAKWLVNETVISEQKLSGDLVSGFYLELKKEGGYTLSGMSTERGTWKLSPDNDSLVTINEDQRRVAYYIKELSNEKLVLFDNSLGTEMLTIFSK